MGNYVDIDAGVIAAFRDSMAAFTSDADWPDDIVEQALHEADAETGGSGWGAFKTSQETSNGAVCFITQLIGYRQRMSTRLLLMLRISRLVRGLTLHLKCW